MIFTPASMPFADMHRGRGWRSKLAKKAAKLAYRDYIWTRNTQETAAAVRRHEARQ